MLFFPAQTLQSQQLRKMETADMLILTLKKKDFVSHDKPADKHSTLTHTYLLSLPLLGCDQCQDACILHLCR